MPVDQPSPATIQGELWSRRARDWAELQEPQHRPKYEDGIRRTGVGEGRSVLDLGCGAGVFCRLAADAGASVTGIDAAPGLLEIARERVPEGQFDVGDIQMLPYEDRSFDIVTAFNSLQFVPDPLRALTEVRRVTKPAANIYILVWGREEHTELVAVMKALHPLVPPRPPGGPGPFALSPPGVLEDFVRRGGFEATETGYLQLPYEVSRRGDDAARPALIRTGGACGSYLRRGGRRRCDCLCARALSHRVRGLPPRIRVPLSHGHTQSRLSHLERTETSSGHLPAVETNCPMPIRKSGHRCRMPGSVCLLRGSSAKVAQPIDDVLPSGAISACRVERCPIGVVRDPLEIGTLAEQILGSATLSS